MKKLSIMKQNGFERILVDLKLGYCQHLTVNDLREMYIRDVEFLLTLAKKE